MKKKQLRQLPSLLATNEMLDIAAQDKPEKEEYEYYFGHTETREIYQYSLYLRAVVKHRILKLSVFNAQDLRLRSTIPTFDIYFSKKEQQFLTYDNLEGKWRTAMLHNLEWTHRSCRAKGYWISPKDAETVKRYFKTSDDPLKAVSEFQESIRKQELIKRHKKITDPWDADLSVVPALPKDWSRWVDKVGIRQNYIFYHYIRNGAKTGYCTFCGNEVPLKQHPFHNREGVCPRCHHPIVFKSYGRSGRIDTGMNYLYLIQRCDGGFVIRCFEASRRYGKGRYESPSISCHEIRRTLYNRWLSSRAYFWGDYAHREWRWVATDAYRPFGYYSRRQMWGKVYGKTLPSLAREELRDTGLCDWIKAHDSICDPEEYLAVLKAVPPWEKVWKANLPTLAKEVWNGSSDFTNLLADPHAGSLVKVLGLDASRLQKLRRLDGNCNTLSWIQHEKASDRTIPDEALKWFSKERIAVKSVDFILDRMSPLQIYHYIQRQIKQYHTDSWEVLRTWRDYLSMAGRLHMDVTDEIVYRCKELRKRHTALVKEFEKKGDDIRAQELSEEYPEVNAICHGLSQKYGLVGKKYAVIAPQGIKDILMEGKALHHCVASSEHYWDRIQNRESYILFLRKTSDLAKPFYTLEVEPNGTIRQKRTSYDRQGKEIKELSKFLLEWQAEVAKRLSSSDYLLAKKSCALRQEELEQLQKDQVIIHIGELQGQLLSDVLRADLMEANVLPAENEIIPAAV